MSTVFLEIINGRYAGTTFSCGTGEVCQVGSRLGADLFLPNDSQLAPLHFVVVNEENSWKVKNLAEKLFVNNQPTKETVLQHGDFIFAGETLFQFGVDGENFSDETPLGKLTAKLSNESSLFCLIDENTDKRILPLLEESKTEFCRLKEGVENLEGLTANPLLIEMPANKHLLETLIRTFWGHGRLVFLQSRCDFDETTKYLRVLLEQTQIKYSVDLRFYDPRMLRVVLGEAEKRHAQFFFGAATTYFVESQVPSHLFKFDWTSDGVNLEMIRLSEEIKKIPTQTEIAGFLLKENLSGDFPTICTNYLQEFLSDKTCDFRILANESLPFIEKYGIEFLPAKIQFVSLGAILGKEFLVSQEIENNFFANTYSSDDKLEFLVKRLNLQRF